MNPIIQSTDLYCDAIDLRWRKVCGLWVGMLRSDFTDSFFFKEGSQ